MIGADLAIAKTPVQSSLRDIFSSSSSKHSSIPAIKLGESDSNNQVEDGQSREDEP
jgi:hypothetical protein